MDEFNATCQLEFNALFLHFYLEEVTSCGRLRVIPSVDPLFTRKLDVLEVIEGRNARFDCKVSGTPSPKVTWCHFGRKAHSTQNFRF